MKSKTNPILSGTPAPDFTTSDASGRLYTLSSFRGRPVVIFFYPRDSTPGCTREACGFRDHWSELTALDVVLFGVSADSAKAHEKFSAKYQLPFPLLVDEDLKIVNAYGAWGQKLFLGRKFMGILRKTFLIGPDGRVLRVWEKVKPDSHAAEVLNAVRQFQQ